MSGVGQILKNSREAKGIAIEQVAEATSIRLLYLKAIEDEQFDIVPGEVYLKGFIRNYANYLGLNGPALVEQYKEQAAGFLQQENPPAHALKQENRQEGVLTASKRREARTKNGAENLLSLLKMFVTVRNLIVVLALLTLVLAGYHISGLFSGQRAKTVLPKPAVTPVTGVKAPDAAVIKGQGDFFTVKNAEKIEVSVAFTSDCWVEAYADRKEAFVGIKTSGKNLQVSADKELMIKFGNIRAATIICNGVKVPYAPDENGVVIRTFKL
jgi:cytoskeletal protein RodZ